MKKLNLFIFTLGLCFSVPSVATNALNLIVTESEELTFNFDNKDAYASFGDHFQPVYLDPYLFFVISENETTNNKLWSYNTETMEFNDLGLSNVKLVQQFKNKVLAVTFQIEYGYPHGPPTYYVYSYWTVDDELNLNSIDNYFASLRIENFNIHMNTTQQHLYFLNNQGGLNQYDTQSEVITSLPHIVYDRYGVMAFCENQDGGASLLTSYGFSGNYFNDSNVSVDTEEIFQYRLSNYIWDSHFFSYENSCYYTTKENINEPYRLRFAITESATKNYLDNDLIEKLSGFTILNNSLFAIEYQQGAIMYTIHQLNGTSMESLNHVDVMLSEPLEFDSVPVLTNNADYLITGTPNVKLFDSRLQEVTLINYQQSDPIKLYHYGYHTPLGDALVINNDHYKNRFNFDYNFSVIDKYYNHNIDLFRYWYENSGFDIEPQKISAEYPKQFSIIESNSVTYRYQANDRIYIDELYVNPSSETLTMVAFDKQTVKRGLYQLEDNPQINQLINGSWYSPDYPSQGLSIAKGIRHDGREYVYLTAYLFRNGNPLWVAGVADLVDQPKTLNIPLYEFNGLQFLEANQNANQLLFGDITLTFSDCDVLETSIKNGSSIENITFYRANNVNQKVWCQ